MKLVWNLHSQRVDVEDAPSVSPPLVVGGGRWDEPPAQVLLWASVGGFTGRHPQGGKHTSRMRGSDKVGGLLLLWLHYFHWWESLLTLLPHPPSSSLPPFAAPPHSHPSPLLPFPPRRTSGFLAPSFLCVSRGVKLPCDWWSEFLAGIWLVYQYIIVWSIMHS